MHCLIDKDKNGKLIVAVKLSGVADDLGNDEFSVAFDGYVPNPNGTCPACTPEPKSYQANLSFVSVFVGKKGKEYFHEGIDAEDLLRLFAEYLGYEIAKK